LPIATNAANPVTPIPIAQTTPVTYCSSSVTNAMKKWKAAAMNNVSRSST